MIKETIVLLNAIACINKGIKGIDINIDNIIQNMPDHPGIESPAEFKARREAEKAARKQKRKTRKHHKEYYTVEGVQVSPAYDERMYNISKMEKLIKAGEYGISKVIAKTGNCILWQNNGNPEIEILQGYPADELEYYKVNNYYIFFP